jgi:hypothetical protein
MRVTPLAQPEGKPALAHTKEDHSNAEHPKAHEGACEHDGCENVWRPPDVRRRSRQADEESHDDKHCADDGASRTQAAPAQTFCRHIG